MPKYVIEREIPNAGKLSAEELQAISQKSCAVLRNLGPQIQWLQSYVTDDKIYCVYIAPNEKMVREHAEQGGFPGKSRLRSKVRHRSDNGRAVGERDALLEITTRPGVELRNQLACVGLSANAAPSESRNYRKA